MDQIEFIEKVKDAAIKTQKEYKIFASVTISQAILESGWGQSELASKYNNYFGIKASDNWIGKIVLYDSNEYTESGIINVKSKFRFYDSLDESIKDYARFLLKSRYIDKGILKATNHEGQIDAIVAGGYCTAPDYKEQLISLINRYNLEKYDMKGNDNMKIAIRGGHNFLALGARGLIDETTEDRKVKDATINYLRKQGHEVLDVTPGNVDKNVDLNYGVSKANDWGADLFISIHFNNAYNSYDGALGTETWTNTNNSTAKTIASRITNNLTSLGFKNRGIKDGLTIQRLYEIRNTKMSAIIIEVCFVESKEDVRIYNKIGYDSIGRAISEAISNKTISNSKSQTPTFKPLPLRMIMDAAAIQPKDDFINISKYFYRDQLVTAIDEKLEFYLLDIEGVKAWIPKKATCLR
ncbi:cell wall-binding protein [Clostridium botulinum C]|uniref:glucosaminidase domain-containing protein n=1 Tax=Clostridium botulinum TaxID=1491 RepID=UPI001E534040|nr:cell wall-binding protein [Clostridium botulinum C]MCD3225141.1 cell wall-binding protein [Clostridium botulinum C]MCD3246770.1 cell wall-binding protein [Clostridium botulinum C]